MKPRPKSGFYGVRASDEKWASRLYYDGKHHSLGRFNTKEEAAVVYDKAAREHKGSAAVCNFANPAEGQAASSAAVGEWKPQPAQPKQPRNKKPWTKEEDKLLSDTHKAWVQKGALHGYITSLLLQKVLPGR
jgi:hypothetical protein